MEENTSTDAAAVVYEAIMGTNGRYRWSKYLNINVIEDTQNGYINATKMCSMYGKTKTGQPKHFTDWKYTNKPFIAYIESALGIPMAELTYAIINGLDSIKGTYVHRDLAVHLAIWCSHEFGYKVSKLINVCIKTENTILVEQNKMLKANNDALVQKIDELNGIEQTLEKVMDKVATIEDQVVIPAHDPKVKELMILMYSPSEGYYIVLRTQEVGMKQAIKRCKRVHGTTFEEVFSVPAYQNPRNLWHRFKDHVHNTEMKNAIKFHCITFRTTFDLDTIKTVFLNLERTFIESMDNI